MQNHVPGDVLQFRDHQNAKEEIITDTQYRIQFQWDNIPHLSIIIHRLEYIFKKNTKNYYS